MQLFISDLHFGHKNCLEFDNRPFDDIESHDKYIIDKWNSLVTDNDTVWILGDVSWYSVQKTLEILKALKGKKCLIVGNHDKKLLENSDFRNAFEEITDYKEIYLDNKKGIVLCHYPIPCYNKHCYGWYHLYGHVHISCECDLMNETQQKMRVLGIKCEMYNVGCMLDYMAYTPRTLEEILKANNAI